jgi:hypothetical protein
MSTRLDVGRLSEFVGAREGGGMGDSEWGSRRSSGLLGLNREHRLMLVQPPCSPSFSEAGAFHLSFGFLLISPVR